MYTSCFCAVTAAAAAARTVELYSIILHATHTLKVALKAVNKFLCHHLNYILHLSVLILRWFC